MYNKVNIKYLTITFFALLAIVLFVSFFGNGKANSSFKSELVTFDSVSVTHITIYPKGGGEPISFEKKNSQWFVSGEDGEYNADNGQIKNMLSLLSGLKAKRLAAKEKDKWGKYELTDSLSTRVKIADNEKDLADLCIGKFSYTQAPQSGNPYMQQRGIMTSFVRLNGEDEVYAVDGFLGMTFSRSAKDFRNSKILELKKDSLSRITFNSSNESFTLTKQDSVWRISGLVADSSSVANYLSALSNVRSNDFLPKNSYPVGSATHFVKFEDKNGAILAKVDAFFKDSTAIAISSTINQGTYFDGAKAGLFDKLFKSENYFIGSK